MDAVAEGPKDPIAEEINENDIQEGVAIASSSVANSPEPQQAMDTHGKPRTPTHSHPRQAPMAEPQQAMDEAMAEPKQSEPRQPLDSHGKPQQPSVKEPKAHTQYFPTIGETFPSPREDA